MDWSIAAPTQSGKDMRNACTKGHCWKCSIIVLRLRTMSLHHAPRSSRCSWPQLSSNAYFVITSTLSARSPAPRSTALLSFSPPALRAAPGPVASATRSHSCRVVSCTTSSRSSTERRLKKLLSGARRRRCSSLDSVVKAVSRPRAP
jgi:hypothetical protein